MLATKTHFPNILIIYATVLATKNAIIFCDQNVLSLPADRKLIIDFRKNKIPGVPDGMTVDNEDKIWVTSFEGHQVVRIDPETGTVLQTIQLDALKVTSVVFAGANLSDLYITSGNYRNTENETKNYPHSGYFFKITNMPVTGRPGVEFETDQSYLN